MTAVSSKAGYLVAVLATVAALIVDELLFSVLGLPPVVLILVPPIMAAAWLGGLMPGLLATALAFVAAIFFVIEPNGLSGLGEFHNQVRAILLVVVGAVISGLCEQLHRSRAHEHALRSEAEADAIRHRLEAVQGKQGEMDLAVLKDRLAVDLADMQHLHELSTRLVRHGDSRALFDQILDAAIAITGTDKGALQMFCPVSGSLHIAAQRGFGQPFLDFFASVYPGVSSCGVALDRGERVIVEDITRSPLFAGTPALDVELQAGVRAIQSTPLTSRSGKTLGMLSTHYRKPHRPSERTLRLLDLLARLAADSIERTQTEEALQEADRRKDHFLATLAHELRNPLTPIRNSLYVLQRVGSDDPMAQQVQGIMERQVDHLVRLVDDLLDVSRITQDKIELRREHVDITAIVRHAVEISRITMGKRHHRLNVELPPDPLVVDADPVRLAQVLSNLLNNAAKFMEEGGQIWVNVRRENNALRLSVRDSGAGMPPELLAHVFDLFFQGKGPRGRSPDGLGIGLTLVHRLVELHGGRIEARSDGVGRGSEFIVRLPLVAPLPAESSTEASHDRQRTAPQAVLVVDDNADVVTSLTLLLRLAGVNHIYVAHDGVAALAALRQHQPKVALVDIGMPGMDGYEVARYVRQQPAFDETKLVALTGWGQEDDRRLAREAGFDHHLVKPVDPIKLEDLLASLTVPATSS